MGRGAWMLEMKSREDEIISDNKVKGVNPVLPLLPFLPLTVLMTDAVLL